MDGTRLTPLQPQTLPRELCHLVIDAVGSDIDLGRGHIYQATFIAPTLKSCALVCRAWRPRAQFWFFRGIRITSISSLPKLVATCEHAHDILSRVRTLEVECRCVSVAQWGGRLLYPAHNPLSSLGTDLGRRLTSVTCLQILMNERFNSPPHVHLGPFKLTLNPRSSICSVELQ